MKIGLPQNWEAAVGFTKWGTVMFSDLVSKGRLARPDWEGQVGKARLAKLKLIKSEQWYKWANEPMERKT